MKNKKNSTAKKIYLLKNLINIKLFTVSVEGRLQCNYFAKILRYLANSWRIEIRAEGFDDGVKVLFEPSNIGGGHDSSWKNNDIHYDYRK